MLGGTVGKSVDCGTFAKQYSCALGMFPGSAAHHVLVSIVCSCLPASMSNLSASAFDTKPFSPLLPANLSTMTSVYTQILLPFTCYFSASTKSPSSTLKTLPLSQPFTRQWQFPLSMTKNRKSWAQSGPLPDTI